MLIIYNKINYDLIINLKATGQCFITDNKNYEIISKLKKQD